MARKAPAAKRVKLLVAIINKEDEQRYADAVSESCVALNYSGIAHGTAASHYLSYFGLNEIEKRVMFSLIPDFAEHKTLSAIGHALKLYLLGKGIAFTLPLSAVSDVIAGAILSAPEKVDADQQKKNKDSKKEKSDMHELVVAVVNQKFTDEAIEAARAAGATGATVFHTKGINNAPAEQKIGTSFKTETDTLFFLTSSEYKLKIMEAVRDTAGLKTEGGAVIFSLPVDDLVGIGRFEEDVIEE
jgi:nitrogen regulatory protein PII